MKIEIPVRQTGSVIDKDGQAWATFEVNRRHPRYWWVRLVLLPLARMLYAETD